MMKKLMAQPLLIGLLAFVLYVAIVLILDSLNVTRAFGKLANNTAGTPPPDGLQDAVNGLPFEFVITVVLIVIVALTGIWSRVGFRRRWPGGLKFVLIPLGLIVLLFGIVVINLVSQGANEVFGWGVWPASLAFVAYLLLVGFSEELMFRGILFQSLRSVLKPWLTVLITAVLFGSMHFVNLFSGASTQGTFEQVLFAFAFGCMAGALRLRVGSIVR